MPPEKDADFRNLVEAHGAVMYRQALRILGNREDAEDAVQDALVRIWKHRSSFDHRARLSTWIFRITYNACCAVRARRDRFGAIEKDLDDISEPGVEAALPADEDMARLLSLLPPVQAAALSLFYVEQLEYKEIADVLKIPQGSVATAIHRGKERLREVLMQRARGHRGV